MDRNVKGKRGIAGALSDGAAGATAGLLAGVARLRGGKAVHPHGTSYHARLLIDETSGAARGSELLGNRGEWPSIVRFSRSVGLPRPVPDLLGMSIRVLNAYGEDEHQDFLLVTSVDLPVLHHFFLPARDTQQRPYSSSLPYRSGGKTFLIGVLPHPDSPRPDGDDEFERLASAAATGRLHFGFCVAPLFGRFARIGELRIESQLPAVMDALCFNPFNTGEDLEPVGLFNRWRRVAYPRSQRAWRRAGRKFEAQDRAEDEMRLLARDHPKPRRGY